MTEMFAYEFMQRGLLGAALTGACCSLVGVFVVLRGMSYVGAGIAHGCLAGVALAFLLGWNPLLLSFLAALVMVVGIEALQQKTNLKMDAAIGVIFALAMALAVLFIGMAKRYTPEILGYLFGNLLSIGAVDLWAMAVVGLIVALVLILFFKELHFSTFDPEMAEVCGIPAGWVSLVLSLLMGLSIVVSLQAVGELLVLALIVLPASTARQFTHSLVRMMIFAVLIGVMTSLIGVVLAFAIDAPTGPTVVILLAACFFGALGIRYYRLRQSRPV
jgi:ABC-type Mn2+/Zn2+ transport system permease subunit